MINPRSLPPPPSGAGGSSKSGSSSTRVAVEDANTLRSRSVARVLLLLGEGPMELIDGAKSIYFDGVPIEAADGTANFSGVSWTFRPGLPDQDPIPGFESAFATRSVDVDVKSIDPVVRTITDPEVDAFQVITRIPALTTQDTSTGDLHGGEVSVAIDIRPAGGVWTTVDSRTISGKCTAPYDFAHPRVELPSVRPVDIRYRRITTDSTVTTMQNTTHWLCFTEITDGKFTYPDCALLAVTVDAQQFGSSRPTVSAKTRKIGTPIPTNYNPDTRTYAGIWDGTFTTGHTDNPMWAAWDAVTNSRYGLGLSPDAIGGVDKWTAYIIARWCDDPVPAGAGGTRPRFTFNGRFESQVDAFSFMQTLAAVFMGKVWWSAGGVSFFADMPRDPDILVVPANVEGGKITRSTTASKSRHTVAVVKWNNPDNGWKLEEAVYADPELVARWGIRRLEFTRAGCSSRAEALAAGAWAIETERSESDAISYVAGPDHETVAPGWVAAVADPSRAAVRRGGRLKSVSADLTAVTLDAAVDLIPGERYSLMVRMPDGSLFDTQVETGSGTKAVLNLSSPLPARPVDAAIWILKGSDVAPKPYRLMDVGGDDGDGRKITAVFHDPTKWDRVVSGVNLAPESYTETTNRPAAPTGLSAIESTYYVNGLPHSRITVSWSPSSRWDIARYAATVITPGGASQSWEPGLICGFEISPADEGVYVIRVAVVTSSGLVSPTAETRITAVGKGTPPSKCSALRATSLKGGVSLEWVNPPESDVRWIQILEATENDPASAYVCGRVAGAAFQRWGLSGLEGRWFWVRAEDFGGNIGDLNSNIGTWGAASLNEVADVGRSILRQFERYIVTSIPIIDLSATTAALIEQDNVRYAEIRSDRCATGKRFAAVDTKIEEIVTDAKALAATVTTLGAEFDDNKALVQTKLEALATADAAQSQATTALVARMGSAEAAIASEATARSTADQALTTRIDQTSATFGTNLAATETRITNWAGATFATASYVQTVQSTVGGLTASVQLLMSAKKGMEAQAFLGISSGGTVYGMDVYGGAKGNAIIMRADNFAIAMPGYANAVPFAATTVNGVPSVAITYGIIGDLTVDTLTIRGGAVSIMASSQNQASVLFSYDSGWVTVAAVTIAGTSNLSTIPRSDLVFVDFTKSYSRLSGVDYGSDFTYRVVDGNGSVFKSGNTLSSATYGDVPYSTHVLASHGGDATVTYKLQVSSSWHSTIKDVVLVVFGSKR